MQLVDIRPPGPRLLSNNGIVTLVAERLGAGRPAIPASMIPIRITFLRAGLQRLNLRPTEGPQAPGLSIEAGLGADFSLRLPAPDDASASNVSAPEDDLVAYGRGE